MHVKPTLQEESWTVSKRVTLCKNYLTVDRVSYFVFNRCPSLRAFRFSLSGLFMRDVITKHIREVNNGPAWRIFEETVLALWANSAASKNYSSLLTDIAGCIHSTNSRYWRRGFIMEVDIGALSNVLHHDQF